MTLIKCEKNNLVMSNEKRFKQSKKFAERALSTWSKWSPFCPYTTKVPFRKELQKIFEMYEKMFIQVKKVPQ